MQPARKVLITLDFYKPEDARSVILTVCFRVLDIILPVPVLAEGRLYLRFCFLFMIRGTVAAKLRSWSDSSITMIEGNFPSPRYGHGFVATENGQVYVFGGQGQGELLRTVAVIRRSRTALKL